MDQFFLGGKKPHKGQDIVHPLKAKLEDLYNGKTSRLAVSRDKLCHECEGRGGKASALQNCGDCEGRGVRIQLRTIGPGMVQQLQNPCPTCSQTGKIIADEKDVCRSCRGKRIFKDRKVLIVDIDKGMKNGEKITFAGEADELPATIAGDVVFVIKEVEHETFKRKGSDLAITFDIEYSEALSGFTKTITQLDGRVLNIVSPPTHKPEPETIQILVDEGMPHYQNPLRKGRLFVIFRVDVPKSADEPIGLDKLQCQNGVS
jgi:DnaJ homolog subfamily A member 2